MECPYLQTPEAHAIIWLLPTWRFFEYTIWRSWEDCLWFQATLKDAYKRAACKKKGRLTQGKGVKGFNGLYKKDLASSWESLPSGPIPNSVAQNTHEYLSTLTRRGTSFWASHATIDRRQVELIHFVAMLFSDDNMPTLIKEIRVSNIFSAFWAQILNSPRDLEHLGRFRLLEALWSTVRSLLIFLNHIHLYHCQMLLLRIPPQTYQRARQQVQLFPTMFLLYSGTTHRASSILEILPEEQETLSKSLEPPRQAIPRPRASAIGHKAHSSYSIFGLSLKDSLLSSEKSGIVGFVYLFLSPWLIVNLGNHSVGESRQVVDSQNSTTNDFLYGLELVLPHPIKEQKFRASIASISTFMATDSAEAVIPQTPRVSQQHSFESNIRISMPLSLTDFDFH